MITVLRKLHRNIYIPIINNYRKWLVLLNARIYRANVSLGKGINFSHPIVFQGKGKLIIGNNVSFGFLLAGSLNQPILLQPRTANSEIIIGNNSAVMNGCELIAQKLIQIGNNSLIGPSTVIFDSDFHGIRSEERHSSGKISPVIIEDNVWIGARTLILKGVHIGENAIVGAGCVVSKDIPNNAIVAGNPMKIIGDVTAKQKL